ncbi:MAG: polysaccharide deacetylase family protein [Clostridia bacterium]|nr:polysaccharide deacetylase family protein [Clostridia bacterium]MBQ7075221.1 polysaccharide deacetylase family protein [Clostridia bacterium]
MIQYNIFPEGKKRIVTFSYDDGRCDEPLVELFNRYNVKATFHLNGSEMDEEELLEKRKLYSKHEISCHTARHGWPSRMPLQSVVGEVLTNRLMLEKMALYPVVGMSYPSGSYSEAVIEAMKASGIVYSRTIKNTMGFELPDNFMEWHPTCHHNQALKLCDGFIRDLDSQWRGSLFYIWGHSHEFKTEDDWNMMTLILEKLSGNNKIWYATNYEIYRYINAQRSLVISADENVFYNPSSTDVWVEKDKALIIHIPAGKTVTI